MQRETMGVVACAVLVLAAVSTQVSAGDIGNEVMPDVMPSQSILDEDPFAILGAPPSETEQPIVDLDMQSFEKNDGTPETMAVPEPNALLLTMFAIFTFLGGRRLVSR